MDGTRLNELVGRRLWAVMTYELYVLAARSKNRAWKSFYGCEHSQIDRKLSKNAFEKRVKFDLKPAQTTYITSYRGDFGLVYYLHDVRKLLG